MMWTKGLAGLVLVGTISGAGCVQATPLTPIPAAPVERVQYYDYDDDGYVPPPPPRYRVYREPPPYRVYRERPAYGYYDAPPRYGYDSPPRYGYRGSVEDQKEAVKDYRKAQK